MQESRQDYFIIQRREKVIKTQFQDIQISFQSKPMIIP